MSLSVRARHLKRYKEIAVLLVKYGRVDLMGSTDSFAESDLQEELSALHGKDLAADLEKLGPTFIKIGQLLSTRSDLLSPAYLESLSRLQDKVEPIEFSDVERIISRELGLRISKVFRSFDSTPIASASLGQVHHAVLRDGREAAVKVQRPGIRARIFTDLEAMQKAADFLDRHTELGARYRFRNMLQEFRRTFLSELDYRQEAANMQTLKENMKPFEHIVIPAPVEGYTTSSLLTMQFLKGIKVTSLGPLARTEIDTAPLAEDLFVAYLHQIMVDGFFHADPHPGNIFITEDGCLALLDLGMVGQIMPRMKEMLLQLIIAVSESRTEEATRLIAKLANAREDYNPAELSRQMSELLSTYQSASLEQIQVGKVLLQIARAAADSGLCLPSEFTILGKALLNLDQVGRFLDPQFDPNASIRRNVAEVARRHVLQSVSPAGVFNTAMELKDFAERMPQRINRILDALADNELKIKVDSIEEETLIYGMQKIANRITMGLILAALIVGAAMLMRVQTPLQVLGYPLIAIAFFFIAAGGGVALIINILWSDR